ESKRGHRLAQIVARGSQKARFCLVGERELPGALFDFLLQHFTRLTEAPGHGVELIREHLKLVSGLNAHPIIEPAGSQPYSPAIGCSTTTVHPGTPIGADAAITFVPAWLCANTAPFLARICAS